MVVPMPLCVSEPVPLMREVRVSSSERLMASAALLSMDVEAMLPLEEPLPICNVPSLIVVMPE